MGQGPCVQGHWAWRAGAHRRAHSQGARGAAPGDQRGSLAGLPLTRGSSAAGASPSCLPTAHVQGGLQKHMHFEEGCLRNPASRRASWAMLGTRACPEVKQKRQKGAGAAAAGGNIH